MGFATALTRRPDGKPEVNGHRVSASHAADVVSAVAGAAGCDLEVISVRPVSVWRDLLGPERFALAEIVARESGDGWNAAATRVWCAMECLKKSGVSNRGPFVFAGARPDGWIELAAGTSRILTYKAAVRNTEVSLAFAVMIEAPD